MPAPVAVRQPGLIDRTVARGICFYQRYISPYKGFHCAHRALHGGDSCSQYVKAVVLRFGVMPGMALARRRFDACRVAAAALRKKRLPDYESLPSRRHRDEGCPCADESCYCADPLPDVVCVEVGPCPGW